MLHVCGTSDKGRFNALIMRGRDGLSQCVPYLEVPLSNIFSSVVQYIYIYHTHCMYVYLVPLNGE